MCGKQFNSHPDKKYLKSYAKQPKILARVMNETGAEVLGLFTNKLLKAVICIVMFLYYSIQ
jgi:hypothetical protein